MTLFFQEKIDAPDPDTGMALKYLEVLQWKRGARKNLLVAVDQSIKNYKAWLKSLQAMELDDMRIDRFRLYVLAVAPSPARMVIDWFKDVKDSVEWRRGYRGNLKNHIWTSRRERWHHKLATWAEYYCGDSNVADRLVEITNEN